MKIEATQKLDPNTGQPTGKRSGSKVLGLALGAVGVLIVLGSGVTEFAHALGLIPDAFAIREVVTWGGIAALAGGALYLGEISGLIDKIPKLGG